MSFIRGKIMEATPDFCQKNEIVCTFLLTKLYVGGKLSSNQYSQHGDENQYISRVFCQRTAGWCEAVKTRVWNSFRSGFLEMLVEEDG